MYESMQLTKRAVSLRDGLVVGGLAALLTGVAGCGGTKVNGNQAGIGSVITASPVAYGLEAFSAVNASDVTGLLESSGLASTDGKTAYATAAVDSNATPLVGLSTPNGKIPLGFSPGGQYVDAVFYGGVTSGTSVVFRAALSNGQNGTSVIPIDPTKVTLTSTDVGGTVPLTFDSTKTTGPLANALYISAPFTVPGGTGLHSYSVSVGDTSGQTSTTQYVVPVVSPADAGVLVQIVDRTGASVAGTTVSITNPVAGTAQAVSDAQGMVVLFAKPGNQTLSVAGNTLNVTLTAGQLLDTVSTTDSDGVVSFTPLVLTEN